MRQLLPEPLEPVDLAAIYTADQRAPRDARPWVMVNMVASADGAATAEGRSSPLSGPPDEQLFFVLRSLPDVVLVGAGTVRIEGYGPARPKEDVRAMRAARGQTPAPRLAIVSRRLDLDPKAAIFTEADARQFVLTTEDSPPDRRAALAEVADVVVAGTGDVDLRDGLAALASHDVSVVLCEGGPQLLGHLVAADVVDELNLTVSPRLVLGPGPRIAAGPALDPPRLVTIGRLLEADGFLFVRYLRA